MAIRELRGMINHNPRDAQAYNRLGIIYSRKDDGIRQSMECFLEAIKLNKNLSNPYHNMGVMCYAWNINESTEQYLKLAIRLNSAQPESFLALAWHYLIKRQDFESSKILFKRAIELSDDLRGHFGLGLVYYADDKIDALVETISHLRSKNGFEYAAILEEMNNRSGAGYSSVSPREFFDVSLEMDTFDKEDQTQRLSGILKLQINVKPFRAMPIEGDEENFSAGEIVDV